MKSSTEISPITNIINKIKGHNSSVIDYIRLMKPRVMSLVVFTAFIGLFLAPGHIHPFIAFTSILCVTLGAGSAASINMWYDRDIDSKMKRTQNRPIVTGAINAEDALSFGVVLGFLSVLLMAICVNLLAAFLLAITISYYVLIYTMWLKRSTTQNVVIGGVAGSLPPVIGWVSVTGTLSIAPLLLFLIIFMWTPPHSWALALYRVDDYRNCKVPMLPVIKGSYYTKKQVIIYTILMFITSLLPFFFKLSNEIYLVVAVITGLIFLYYAFSLFNDKTNQQAKKLFIYSIFYLFIIFLSLSVFKI